MKKKGKKRIEQWLGLHDSDTQIDYLVTQNTRSRPKRRTTVLHYASLGFSLMYCFRSISVSNLDDLHRFMLVGGRMVVLPFSIDSLLMGGDELYMLEMAFS